MIDQYRDLFVNRDDVYARQHPDGRGYTCVRAPVTDRVLADHLAGRITCGFYCLNRADTVKWGVVDFDTEEGRAQAQMLHHQLAALTVPSVIEQSRGGRAHLWVFTDAYPARAMRQLLTALADNEHCEVFPKQERLTAGGLGSLVRGPLGIHRKTGERYGFLDPATLAPLNDAATYLAHVEKAEAHHLTNALNRLARQRPRRRADPPPSFPHEDDVLAVAALLGIQLRPQGSYYQGICPLHPTEAHPSFTIYPNRNVWICWHDHRVGYGGASLFAAVTGISLEEARATLTARL